MSDERIDSTTASNYRSTQKLSYYGSKIKLKIDGGYLKQDKITHNHGKIVNTYIVYKISNNFNSSSYPTLENCLFGAIALVKNVDIDQYKYSGYGIEFDRKGIFSSGNGFGRNLVIFVGMSSSVHVDNKKKDILILGEGPTEGLGENSLSAEEKGFNQLHWK